MRQDMVDEVLKSLDTKTVPADDSILLRGMKHNPVPFSPDNFHSIADKDPSRKIAFIDGGNQEILKTPASSLQFIRVYYTIYSDNKRVKSGLSEFYVLLKSSSQQSVSVKFFDTELFTETLSFSMGEFDSEANLSTVGNLVRRLAELKVASTICEEIKGGFLVLDGSLYCPNSKERGLMRDLSEQAFNSSVAVAAISKTSHLVTCSGMSLTSAISSLLPESTSSPWYYHPLAVADDHKYRASPILAMLNPSSSHLFLIDVADLAALQDLLSLLVKNSTDPVFRGYPYGLVEADRFARVSNQEASQMKTVLLAKAGKDWKRITRAESPLNAHDILDKIM